MTCRPLAPAGPTISPSPLSLPRYPIHYKEAREERNEFLCFHLQRCDPYPKGATYNYHSAVVVLGATLKQRSNSQSLPLGLNRRMGDEILTELAYVTSPFPPIIQIQPLQPADAKLSAFLCLHGQTWAAQAPSQETKSKLAAAWRWHPEWLWLATTFSPSSVMHPVLLLLFLLLPLGLLPFEIEKRNIFCSPPPPSPEFPS